jgi:hypothetical protein
MKKIDIYETYVKQASCEHEYRVKIAQSDWSRYSPNNVQPLLKVSTCQEISWQKEILGSGRKNARNPFWKEIDRKYNELPG